MSSPAQESLLTSYWLVRSRTYDRPVASFQSQSSRSLGQLRLRGGLLALSCLAATLGPVSYTHLTLPTTPYV